MMTGYSGSRAAKAIECSEGDKSRFELRNRLFHEQLCRFSFWHDANVSAGFGVNSMRFFLAEIVIMLFAPMLVSVCECLFGFLTDAAAMPKLCYKVHPLFTPGPSNWA